MNTNELIEGHNKLDYAKESVKISKNSKGYTWEVKIVPEEGDLFSDKDFHRLLKLEGKLFNQYGENKW